MMWGLGSVLFAPSMVQRIRKNLFQDPYSFCSGCSVLPEPKP